MNDNVRMSALTIWSTLSTVKWMTDEKQQRILRAATEVFLRYGYRRATMDDIAQEVGMSRPALYLRYAGKEAILRAVMASGFDDMFQAMAAGLPDQNTVSARLRLVFEHWSVRPYDLVARAPAAGELINSSFSFAKDITDQSIQRLTGVLAEVMRAAIPKAAALQLSAEARARVMIAAAHGFKSAAQDTQDMRSLVDDLVRMTVAGLPDAVLDRHPPGRLQRGKTAKRSKKAR